VGCVGNHARLSKSEMEVGGHGSYWIARRRPLMDSCTATINMRGIPPSVASTSDGMKWTKSMSLRKAQVTNPPG
jgi:hypothetical protein